MRYSVYDYTRRMYDYYDAPGPGGTHASSPPAPRAVGDIGASPSRASWRLPIGAHKVGTGVMPQGRIASMGGLDEMGDFEVPTTPGYLIAYAAALYLGWRILR